MLITAGDQSPNIGIKTDMLRCSVPNELRTVDYLSSLHEAQDSPPVLQPSDTGWRHRETFGKELYLSHSLKRASVL